MSWVYPVRVLQREGMFRVYLVYSAVNETGAQCPFPCIIFPRNLLTSAMTTHQQASRAELNRLLERLTCKASAETKKLDINHKISDNLNTDG